MRYIRFPSPITIQETTLDFRTWLSESILIDPKLGKTAQTVMAAADIRERLSKTDGPLELSDNEWMMLKEVIEEPTGGYNTAVAIHCTPFLRAFLEAPTG